MYNVIRDWYYRHFTDPQAVILMLGLTILFGIVILLGDILAPVLVAVVLAYLLDGLVTSMNRWGIPRTIAATLVLLVFVVFALGLLFGVVPLLSKQVTQLVRELPNMVTAGQDMLMTLPERYPTLFTVEQVDEVIASLRTEVGSIGQAIVSFSLSNVANILVLGIYAVLVPLIVFFALKDKYIILKWLGKFLPKSSELSLAVWLEVDGKIANYIRGKFIEILIVWGVTYLTFVLMGLNFAMLLSFLVGISVIIPFVGAVAVTVPVGIIAFFQWGITPQFWYLLLAYQVIQILDGNVLVPLLFSEVVNLHPLAIIVAVLFFGGLWGVWGVFFAIPLATLIQAVINAWPAAREPKLLHSEAAEL
ncbi:AI-2E family transporter [Granulosicoccaceae sp. 1_MG-2023]|nr:AI-2E family transporter [Granulosicoccaceae sp. 1_MG-2023]